MPEDRYFHCKTSGDDENASATVYCHRSTDWSAHSFRCVCCHQAIGKGCDLKIDFTLASYRLTVLIRTAHQLGVGGTITTVSLSFSKRYAFSCVRGVKIRQKGIEHGETIAHSSTLQLNARVWQVPQEPEARDQI